MITFLPILHKLYRIPAKSKSEQKMIQYLTALIPKLADDIKVEVIKDNIYVTRGIAETYPCIVCHTDQVQENNKNITLLNVDDLILGFDFIKKKQVGIGADDKNGIFMALLALIHFPVMKACFFHGEEIGCIGSSACEMDFFSNCRYVIQCDRKDNSDFISTGSRVDLCSKEFIDDCKLDEFGYKSTSGLITDVVTLKQRNLPVSCCNISCGYYNPHTDYETTSISDLQKCWKFVKHVLSLEKTYLHKYEPPKIVIPSTKTTIVQNKTPKTKGAEPHIPLIQQEGLVIQRALACINFPTSLMSIWLEMYRCIPGISFVRFQEIFTDTYESNHK